MPRDASGTYTLPPSNPVQTGTPIQSTGWANPSMSDIGNELTNSLDRAGRGGMTGPFGVTDGSLSAPGMRFTNDSDNGLRRTGTNTWTLVAAGVDILQVNANGLTLVSGIAVGFGASVDQSDAPPSGFIKGDLWFESDSGNFYVQYENPDLTLVSVGVNSFGGAYVPLGSVGVANGVASLDASGRVPTSQGGVPAGAMFDFGGTVAPTGYVLCDGASYTTAAQPTLFAAIGYTWGGSGANFNVPNFTRRTAVGSGGTGTATLGNTVGSVGGEETHTLLDSEMPATLSGEGWLYYRGSGGVYSVGAGTLVDRTNIITATPFNVMQPSAVVTKIIKT